MNIENDEDESNLDIRKVEDNNVFPTLQEEKEGDVDDVDDVEDVDDNSQLFGKECEDSIYKVCNIVINIYTTVISQLIYILSIMFYFYSYHLLYM